VSPYKISLLREAGKVSMKLFQYIIKYLKQHLNTVGVTA
jgi:hypothetical protein